MTRFLIIVIIVFWPPLLALSSEPAPFDFRWAGSEDPYLRIEPTDDGGVIVSSEARIEDATVPLLAVLHAQLGCDHTEAEHSDSNLDHVRILAKKWVYVDEGRRLFVAWSPHHTCTAKESTHYFKLVDGNDFSRELGRAGRVWRLRQVESAVVLLVLAPTLVSCASHTHTASPTSGPDAYSYGIHLSKVEATAGTIVRVRNVLTNKSDARRVGCIAYHRFEFVGVAGTESWEHFVLDARCNPGGEFWLRPGSNFTWTDKVELPDVGVGVVEIRGRISVLERSSAERSSEEPGWDVVSNAVVIQLRGPSEAGDVTSN
jgi:hypothetical protein